MKTLIICDNKDLAYSLEKTAKSYGREVICYDWFLKALDNLCEIAPDEVVVNCADFPRQWKTLAQYVRSATAMTYSPKVILYTALLHGRRSTDKKGLPQKEQEKANLLDVSFYDDMDAIFSEVTEVPTVSSLLKGCDGAANLSEGAKNNANSRFDTFCTSGNISKGLVQNTQRPTTESSVSLSRQSSDALLSVTTLLQDVSGLLPTVSNLLDNLINTGGQLFTVGNLFGGFKMSDGALFTVGNLLEVGDGCFNINNSHLDSDSSRFDTFCTSESDSTMLVQQFAQGQTHTPRPTTESSVSLNRQSSDALLSVTTLLQDVSGLLPTVSNLLQESGDTLFSVNSLFGAIGVKNGAQLFTVSNLLNGYCANDEKYCTIGGSCDGELLTVSNLFGVEASNVLFTVANLLTRGDLTDSTTLFTVSNLLSVAARLPATPSIILPTVETLLSDTPNDYSSSAVLYTVANLFARMPRDVLYTVSNLFEKCAAGDIPLYTVANLFTKIAKDCGVDIQLHNVMNLFRGTHYGSLLKKIIADYI